MEHDLQQMQREGCGGIDLSAPVVRCVCALRAEELATRQATAAVQTAAHWAASDRSHNVRPTSRYSVVTLEAYGQPCGGLV